MAAAAVSSNPRNVEEIFKDYSARRAALLRALTKDVDDFYSQCDAFAVHSDCWLLSVSFYFGARLSPNESLLFFQDCDLEKDRQLAYLMECNKLLLQQFSQIHPPGYPKVQNETTNTTTRLKSRSIRI
uniref:PHD finger protein ALFIN-LIKE n=1 Tax=Arabidopsis halleri subsp. halleri TaxID=81971 RepID=I0J3E3_ARAHH|nr:unknown [Arabidopsis halleri subsp. halleri]